MEEKDMDHVASHINAKSGVNLEQFITVSCKRCTKMLQSVAHVLSANLERSNFKSQEQALAGNFQLYRL